MGLLVTHTMLFMRLQCAKRRQCLKVRIVQQLVQTGRHAASVLLDMSRVQVACARMIVQAKHATVVVLHLQTRQTPVVIALVTLVTLGSNVFTHAPTQMRAMVTALVLAALPDAFAIATRSIGAHRANSVPMGILAGLIAS